LWEEVGDSDGLGVKPISIMSIFSESNMIIRAVEAHLVKETYSTIPVLGYFKRLIWLPTKFLRMGVEEKLRGASVWALLSFVAIMLGTWFINDPGAKKTGIESGIIFIAMAVSLFLVVFSMPSIYGHSGVTEETVKFVVKHLQGRGFTCIKDIELLKKSIKLFEDRCRSRANILKWLVGLLWAGFTYAYSKSIEHPIYILGELMPFAFALALLLLGTVFAYLCVWGYDAALDRLFRAIEFGCNDFCHLLEMSSSEQKYKFSG